MQIKEKIISTQRTARYYINDSELKNFDKLLFLIHGYAQLAGDFIREFEFLDDMKVLIIAPEGLSRFYYRNNIGASWMTKDDRLNEIKDYVVYLDNVYQEINNSFDISKTKKYLLGFSQGVHTAVRWFTGSKHGFDELILCSSDFPKDADFGNLKLKLKNSTIHYLHGKNDDVVGMEKYNESKLLLRNNEIPFKEILFDGRHEINENTVKEIILS